MQHSHHAHDLHLEDMQKEKKSFYAAISIGIFFLLLELIGGFIANSLALISDALHLFLDVGALLLGIFVIALFKRPPTLKKSFGFQRAEVLGSLLSGILLWILMIFLVWEGIERLFQPEKVQGVVVLIIASIGVIANFIMMKLLHPGEKGSMNLRAAYLHILGDLLGSIGVVISGIIIWLTGFYPIDPIITFFMAALILYSSGKMIFEGVHILMEGVPTKINIKALYKDLLNLPGVKEVHDLHVWSLSTKQKSLSVHLVATFEETKLLKLAHHLIEEKYHIHHMTIQIEDPKHFESKYCFDCHNQHATSLFEE
ncbi:MAG TPA: cation diffusion facilitator family transporter [Chlamydiales bacterium]|nr:cation diffusion facilitator family transporter [Chlamydiales bacterium]